MVHSTIFQVKTQVSKIKRVALATLLKWAVSIKPYPTRDSTRIVKHTFDVAKIGLGFIYYISKYFGRKNAIPTLFSNFSPFSFFISNLFITFANYQ